jgi:hypothetical protein
MRGQKRVEDALMPAHPSSSQKFFSKMGWIAPQLGPARVAHY